MKKIFLSVLLTLLVNILCLPLWTECDYGGFIRTLFNKEARLDLLYSGKITRAEPFQYSVTPIPSHSSWKYETGNNNIHRVNLSLRTSGEWQKFSLQLKAQRDGKITMIFRGPEVHDEYGFFYSVLTDWRNVKINDKTIFLKEQAFSFNKHFTKQLSIKKGDAFHIEADVRRHYFSIHDFTGLKSGKIWYVITGNLLFFSLIYRLLSCVRGGGIEKVDYLFLAIFFPMLFIPMIGISDAVRSVRESRTLAKKPALKDLFKEKSDYGRRYENWFNDHFCGRVPLINLHDVLRNKLSLLIQGKSVFYIKENRWDFLTYPLKLDYEPSLLHSIPKNILEMNQFCVQNGIKLYILEVPSKEIIYKEVVKKYYGFNEKKEMKASHTQETIRNEVRKHQIPYIYPYKALRDAAKSDFVFFKWTHHWTDWGAFIGYRELMKEINKDFPDMPVTSLDDYTKFRCTAIRDGYLDNFRDPGWQLSENLNYEETQEAPEYIYYDHKNGNEITCKAEEFIRDFAYPKGKYKIMLIGTSQNDNLNHFLPYSATQTKYVRLNKKPIKAAEQFKILKLYKKEIIAFKPDILILSISTADFHQLRKLCSTK